MDNLDFATLFLIRLVVSTIEAAALLTFILALYRYEIDKWTLAKIVACALFLSAVSITELEVFKLSIIINTVVNVILYAALLIFVFSTRIHEALLMFITGYTIMGVTQTALVFIGESLNFTNKDVPFTQQIGFGLVMQILSSIIFISASLVFERYRLGFNLFTKRIVKKDYNVYTIVTVVLTWVIMIFWLAYYSFNSFAFPWFIMMACCIIASINILFVLYIRNKKEIADYYHRYYSGYRE